MKQQQQKHDYNHDPLILANEVQPQCVLKSEYGTLQPIIYQEDMKDVSIIQERHPLLSSLCCYHSRTNLHK